MFIIVYTRMSDTVATQMLLALQIAVAGFTLVLGCSLLRFGRMFELELRNHSKKMKSKLQYESNAVVLSRTAYGLSVIAIVQAFLEFFSLFSSDLYQVYSQTHRIILMII